MAEDGFQVVELPIAEPTIGTANSSNQDNASPEQCHTPSADIAATESKQPKFELHDTIHTSILRDDQDSNTLKLPEISTIEMQSMKYSNTGISPRIAELSDSDENKTCSNESRSCHSSDVGVVGMLLPIEIKNIIDEANEHVKRISPLKIGERKTSCLSPSYKSNALSGRVRISDDIISMYIRRFGKIYDQLPYDCDDDIVIACVCVMIRPENFADPRNAEFLANAILIGFATQDSFGIDTHKRYEFCLYIANMVPVCVKKILYSDPNTGCCVLL